MVEWMEAIQTNLECLPPEEGLPRDAQAQAQGSS
jgi:hypothetical protein